MSLSLQIYFSIMYSQWACFPSFVQTDPPRHLRMRKHHMRFYCLMDLFHHLISSCRNINYLMNPLNLMLVSFILPKLNQGLIFLFWLVSDASSNIMIMNLLTLMTQSYLLCCNPFGVIGLAQYRFWEDH